VTDPIPEQARGRHHRPLPPLRALPALDTSRRDAWIERHLARAADRRTLPAWGKRFALPRDALERALAYIGATGRRRVAALVGDDPSLPFQLVAGGVRPTLLVPSAAAVGPCRRLSDRAMELAEEHLRERQREQERLRRASGWWAGGASPRTHAQGGVCLPPPGLVVASAGALPLAGASADVVVAADVLHLSDDWQAAAAEWARILAPGGRLMLASLSERDQDAPGFLSAVGRILWPGVVSGFPRSQDLTWILNAQRLLVESASVFRLRMDFDAIARLGGDTDALAELLAGTSESLRALYEIDEEGMTWRYLMLQATRLPEG
jgi:SAM-dependent methyltransferase